MVYESLDVLRSAESDTSDKIADDPKNTSRRTERQLCVIVIICVILITLLIVLVFLFSFQLNQEQRRPQQKCDSADCAMVAGDILSKMNLSVHPCENFYEYACGAAIRDPLIPPSVQKWGTFSKASLKIDAILKRILDEPDSMYKKRTSTAVEKAKIFYHACMNTTVVEQLGNQPIQKLIKSLGSWPLTTNMRSGTWRPDSWSLERSLAKSHLVDGSGLFRCSVGLDDMNVSAYIINFDQSGLLLKSYDAYLANQSEKYQQAYVDYASGVMQLLGVSRLASQKAADRLWQFETKLAQFYKKNEERQDVWKLYNRIHLRDLQSRHFGSFQLSDYLRELFGNKFSMSEEVTVSATSYLEKMTSLVENTPKETLANYIVWNTLYSKAKYMPNAFQNLYQELQRTLFGSTNAPPRWQQCVAATDQLLGFATGALYVDRYFSAEDRTEAEVFLQYIIHAFKTSLPTTDWMDQGTIDKALEKVKALRVKVGYPFFIASPQNLDAYFSNLEVRENELFGNLLSGLTFDAERVLSHLGQEPDRSEWLMIPTEVNAYYARMRNEIAFPVAILQQPFYGEHFPMALNFGSLGFIAGHELTHGFDNKGGNYDQSGNMFDWWTNDSREKFNQKKKCLVHQYNMYPVADSHVNGITTLNENIADNGGLKTSFKAYIRWLNDHGWVEPHLPGLNMTEIQLFFLGFAQTWCTYYTPEYEKDALDSDPHAHTKYRVIGALSNSPEFSDAFGCSIGVMSRLKKCSVW